ncbi:hypothetical protein BWI97_15675 [Siphonobacter sp. BAB-5405]|uniref:hypothetical protein n=1 Tax=Siphonobacter sp. BAB-5405 TaxID=1864825 RepID=UPI000C80E448|nr:hypothetical protein [Siphonobacter sp. BAB-5405]PMD94835.1 hypothetical protein BWI97_15675 [Siphonobacter sp. BAB-5405]
MKLSAKIQQEEPGKQLQDVQENQQQKAKMVALEQKVDAVTLGRNPKGSWNPKTNTPNIVATLVKAGDSLIVKLPPKEVYHSEVMNVDVQNGDEFILYGDEIVHIENSKVPGAETVTPDTLAPDTLSMLPENYELGNETVFYPIVADQQGRLVLYGTKDGRLWGNFQISEQGIPASSIGGDKLKTASIDLSRLASEVKDVMPVNYDGSGLTIYPIVTDQEGRLVLYATSDSQLHGNFQISEQSLPAGSVGSDKLKTASVNLTKLASDVAQVLVQSYDTNGRTRYPIVMDDDGRLVLSSGQDGSILGKFDLSLSKVPYTSLPSEVTGGLITTYEASNVTRFPLVMDQDGKVCVWIEKDGSLSGKISLAVGSVTEESLSDAVKAKLVQPAFSRLNSYNPAHVQLEDDESWRGKRIEIPLSLPGSGIPFHRFPSLRVPHLRGINTTDVSLEFRRSMSLAIRGKVYQGTFDPTVSGFVGLNLRTPRFGDASTAWPPLANPQAGDYVERFKAGSTTEGGLPSKRGDLLVYNGSTWGVQPGPTSAAKPGDFWRVTAAGKFGDLDLKVDDILISTGPEFNGGTGTFPRYIVRRPGEFFVMGECSSANVPAVTLDGALYIFSNSSTVKGVAGNRGDYLIYENGVWGLYSGGTVTVAPGATFVLNCSNANEWEVRRADVYPGIKGITAYSQVATLYLRVSDGIVLFSDSMFGNGFIGTTIATLVSPRSCTTESFGGGTSWDVLSMVHKRIRSGDIHAGKLHVFWHGQNNQYDTAQTKEVAYRLASLMGAAQRRFLFWSVLGQRAADFDGNRITVPIQEGAFAGTNHISEIENFYEYTFPRQWFCPRKALLTWAATQTDVPDLQYPGKSVAETAALYGVVPLNVFLSYASLPNQGKGWNFQGYRSEGTMPTGGLHLDYFIRTDNGNKGYFYVNNQGVWSAISFDFTHLNSFGGPILAQKFYEFLTLNNL